MNVYQTEVFVPILVHVRASSKKAAANKVKKQFLDKDVYLDLCELPANPDMTINEECHIFKTPGPKFMDNLGPFENDEEAEPVQLTVIKGGKK